MNVSSASGTLFRPGILRECWNFRGFILASVKRDFATRYLGTQLGFVWAILQPLVMIAIYTVVFARIMRPALPGHDWLFAYSVYLCAGIFLWQLFADLLSRCVGIFVHNSTLLKKVNLPKLALPITAALSALLNFCVAFVLFLAFLLAIGHFPGTAILALVPVILLVVAFAVGLGVLLGTINVFYRDVEQSTSMLLQFWFWLTPIVYPAAAVPDTFARLLALNPMSPVMRFAQSVLVDDRVPPWSSLAYPAAFTAGLLALGWIGFRKLSGEIVDEL